VWERFATAIKIDRIPLFDVSRHGAIGRLTPRRDSMFISAIFDQTGRALLLSSDICLSTVLSYETSLKKIVFSAIKVRIAFRRLG
jgi:hypothetical protein